MLPGARVRCYNFANELNKLGADAHVISFKDHIGAKDGKDELEMEDAERIWHNIRAFLKLPRDPNAILFIQRIHYHYLAPLLAHEAWGDKLVLDVDDWDLSYNPFKRLSRLPWLKGEYLHRRVGKASACCVAASKNLEKFLLTINPKTYYIPTGVDTDQFDFQKAKNGGRTGNSEVVYSWVGTVFRKDNVENLLFIIDCFAKLNRKRSDVRLEIVGGGPLFDTVTDYIRRQAPRANIHTLGWKAPETIQDYLAGIDVGLFPLKQNSPFNISKSPTKLFEYMALGKTTVSHSIGDIAEVIADGETGFLADLDNPGEFVDKMERLAADPLLRKRMGQRALERVTADFSLHVLCGRLLDILVKL